MLKRNLKRLAIDSYQSQSVVNEEARKYQTLLQDYFILQKEFVSIKKNLQTTEQKRDILMAEVQFLRQRHRYLMDVQSDNLQPEQDPVPLQDSAMQYKDSQDMGKPPKPKKKPTNGLTNDKRVVQKRVEKKEISWQDQSASMEV
ncbi:uncharacterized protein LOC8274175 [Ricinus communis]|uniref:Uncharacterized protein n=1 Tax=Ricinus communis TaxID=3988 RepID=B9RNU8_RICCO|nr:uncharacterized protein LOC8274175 [Ricinus communis]EEF46866.1 conserved hypothetical protein [Ricinus communis]|eukprot:XP_002515417.1 uncharacterized protein LOC8274175 [Ricinus communis]